MSENNSIFINGKKIAVEILQGLPKEVRNNLIKQMKIRNPSVTSELEIEAHSFELILNTSEVTKKKILEYASVPVIAVSLASISEAEQKSILKILPRERALEAFQILKTRKTSLSESKKAQDKILMIATELVKRKVINI